MNKQQKVRYVLSQGQDRDHHCHWPGCGKQVPPAMWGCKKHWMMLPKHLRDAIWSAYRPGQEKDWTPSREYLEVADEVQRWIEAQFPQPSSNGDGVPMPAQKVTSGLFKKYGKALADAAKKHAADEPDYGFVSLPPGINNGIAKLARCYFEQYKSGPYQGEYYFRASGVVVTPEVVQTKDGPMRVAGLQTSIMVPCCATKKGDGTVVPMEVNVARVQNEMKILGVADPTALYGENLEATAAALQEAAPYFKFTTSPRRDMKTQEVTGAWENWHGVKGLEDFVPPDAEGVDDDTGEGGESGDGGEPASDEEAAEGEGTFSEFTPEEEVAALVAKADEDEEAQARLKELALANGWEEGEVDEAPSWAAVAKMALAQKEEQAAEETEWEPAKGDNYKYKPVDPKTKKAAAKAVQVEVSAVDKKNRKVDLINAVDRKKVYKGISWDDLESFE